VPTRTVCATFDNVVTHRSLDGAYSGALDDYSIGVRINATRCLTLGNHGKGTIALPSAGVSGFGMVTNDCFPIGAPIFKFPTSEPS
jgi:hypothetical protein